MEVATLELLFERLEFAVEVVDEGLLVLNGVHLHTGDLFTAGVDGVRHHVNTHVVSNDVQL